MFFFFFLVSKGNGLLACKKMVIQLMDYHAPCTSERCTQSQTLASAGPLQKRQIDALKKQSFAPYFKSVFSSEFLPICEKGRTQWQLEKGSGQNSCGSTHTSSKRLAALSNCCMVAHMWATFIRHLLADLQERGEVVKVEEERTPTCKHSKNISSDFIPPTPSRGGMWPSDWLISQSSMKLTLLNLRPCENRLPAHNWKQPAE